MANEPGDIAEGVYAAYDPGRRHSDMAGLTRLLFRGAAFVGRVRLVASRSGWSAAGEVVSVSQAKVLLESLWSPDVVFNPGFSHRLTASAVAEELAELCLSLPNAFADAAFEAARPHAEKFPVDFRHRGLWRVVANHGNRELLCAWLRHWLDANGEVWKCAPGARVEIAQQLVPLARELGEHSLAECALERARWSKIGYQSEERSFAEAIRWVRELCRREPTSWSDEGWKIWSFAEACEQQSCSIRDSSELEEAIMAAAMRCGPKEAWQLLAAMRPKSSDRRWHYITRNRLGDGFAEAIRGGAKFSLRERLTLWCLVVSFCRWLDRGDIITLAKLREELLGACADQHERAGLLSELERLTPGEKERRYGEERERRVEPSFLDEPPLDFSLDAAILAVEGGGKLRVSEVAKAVRHLTRTYDARRHSLIPRLLGAVGSAESYVISWSWGDSFVDSALASIAAQVTDEQLWALASERFRSPAKIPRLGSQAPPKICIGSLLRVHGCVAQTTSGTNSRRSLTCTLPGRLADRNGSRSGPPCRSRRISRHGTRLLCGFLRYSSLRAVVKCSAQQSLGCMH